MCSKLGPALTLLLHRVVKAGAMRWRPVLITGVGLSLLVLAGCGAEEPPALTPTVAVAVTLLQPTAAPTEAPTPEPTATIPPTAIPTPGPEMEKTLKAAYVAVLSVQSSEVFLEVVAARIQEGKLQGFKGLVAVAAAKAVLLPAEQAFAKPAPTPELQPVWDQGQATAEALAGVVQRWTERKIDASDIPAELEPVKAQIDELRSMARQIILDHYNLDDARLDEWHNQTLEEMQSRLDRALGE